MIYYLVIKEAIYMHGISGIFDNEEDAIDMMHYCANLDTDNHHDWTVYEVDSDGPMHKEEADCFHWETPNHATLKMKEIISMRKPDEP